MAIIHAILSEVKDKEIPDYPDYLPHDKFALSKLKNGFLLQEYVLIHGYIDRQLAVDGVVTDCSSQEFEQVLVCALGENKTNDLSDRSHDE